MEHPCIDFYENLDLEVSQNQHILMPIHGFLLTSMMFSEKSMTFKEKCISMHFKEEQRISFGVHELFMKLNEFQYKSTSFHENQLFQCISMIFHEGHEFQFNHYFQYFSKWFHLFTIKLKSVFFHWVPWVTLTFIDAHGNALVYFDVHWNSIP